MAPLPPDPLIEKLSPETRAFIVAMRSGPSRSERCPLAPICVGLTKKHAGTGCGLSLTKRLVEVRGGSVGVLSTVGKGSTFCAVLPRQVMNSGFSLGA